MTIFPSIVFYYVLQLEVDSCGLIPIAAKDFIPVIKVEPCAMGTSKCKNWGFDSLKVTQ